MTPQVFFGLLIAAIFLLGFFTMQKTKSSQQSGSSLHYEIVQSKPEPTN